jgi:hypothetical protein
LFAFASLPMFAIIFAHTNDFIPKKNLWLQVLHYNLHLA